MGRVTMLGIGLTLTGAVGQEAQPLKDQKEKRSYALGVEVGNTIRNRSVDVDQAVLFQGIKDALSGGRALLSQEEVRAVLVDLQAELKRKLDAAEAEKVLAASKLAEKNKSEGETFLTANKTKAGVVTLESGLQYKILKAGIGKRPSSDDTVVCNYRATFVDGTEFNTTYKENKPVTFPLKQIIKGWQEALQLMPVGSMWQLFVPSQLAYGSRGSGSVIGPDATLIYEVELLEVKDPSIAAGLTPETRDALNKLAAAAKQRAADERAKAAGASPAH